MRSMSPKNRAIGATAGDAARTTVEGYLAKAGLTRETYMRKLRDLYSADSESVQLGAVRTTIELYGDNAPVKVAHEGEVDVSVGLSPELQEMYDSVMNRATTKPPDEKGEE